MNSLILHVVVIVESCRVERLGVAGGLGSSRRGDHESHCGLNDGRSQMHSCEGRMKKGASSNERVFGIRALGERKA